MDALTEFLKSLDDESSFHFGWRYTVGFADLCEGLLENAVVICGDKRLEVPGKNLRRPRLFHDHTNLFLRPYVIKSTSDVNVFSMVKRFTDDGNTSVAEVLGFIRRVLHQR